MSGEAGTKICKMCYREIPAAARKCPSCRTYQDWFHMTLVNPWIMAVLIGLPYVLILGLMLSFSSESVDWRADFSKYKDQVKVVSSEIRFGEDEKGKIVSVVGRVKNGSRLTWMSIVVEAQCFDSDGKLIDVVTGGVDEGGILPGADAGFKAVGRLYLPAEEYKSYKVFVRYAEDL